MNRVRLPGRECHTESAGGDDGRGARRGRSGIVFADGFLIPRYVEVSSCSSGM